MVHINPFILSFCSPQIFEQAMNWLIRSVVQQVCLHDLLWFFVDSLVPNTEEENEGGEEEGDGESKKKNPKKDSEASTFFPPIFSISCHPCWNNEKLSSD